MRWCRFARGGHGSYGLVDGETVLAVEGTPFGAHRETGERHALGEVRLLPPVIPGTFYAAGFNYKAHAKEIPARAEAGYRAPSALIGHGEPVVKPADVEGRFETEGELVAVIGRTLRRCSRDEAMAGVFGWTIGNDVSARTWQHGDRTLWRAKNSDTFKPMGPWIDTGVDALAQRTTVTVNDVVEAEFATGEMIFDPYDFITEITRYITMSPGDVLWLGTESVVPMAPGDTVAIGISGLGVLSNPIVQEET